MEGLVAKNVAQKILSTNLISGELIPGKEIGIRIDQTLCQDATGTMVMLELEALGAKDVKTDVSCQYIDHNILQTDFKNADDHLFLQSACQRFGVWFSRPGNGVSHPVHMENFGKPGKILLGSDSHTCAGGSMGMLAMGAGGLEVALAMIGQPTYISMPKIWGIRLDGNLPDWVSAKDIILEMLRRHDVDGGIGKIIEYYGPGLKNLSAMDRHVIANMGAELGATGTVFPSDENTKLFLESQNRGDAWLDLQADPGATYDEYDEIDLSKLEPLIACPHSPGNVVPVSQVAGKPIHQAMIGSSANPGLRDFAISAEILKSAQIHKNVSFDIIPSSRQVLQNLTAGGWLQHLIQAGARIHQAGCNGCIGMGQAPASNTISLRTVPRNFKGRSGTKDDQVYLCSPETATASAITGTITDPRTLQMKSPCYIEPKKIYLNAEALIPPPKRGEDYPLIMGPNIKTLPKFTPVEEKISGNVLLHLGDNISTDEILPAGTKVLPFRSNIPEISKFTFGIVDETFYDRAMKQKETGRSTIIVGGNNYGQGSSREHAAIAPRYLGVSCVIAKKYARIHHKNLVNFGILPFVFVNTEDYAKIKQNDELEILDVHAQVRACKAITATNKTQNLTFQVSHNLSEREIKEVLAGGLINYFLQNS